MGRSNIDNGSYPVGFEPCPTCRAKGADRSGDNFIKYSDGHYWCFSCSKGQWPNGREFKPQVEREVKRIALPDDCIDNIPWEPATWLSSYDITREEVKRNFITWSPSRQLLIFPFYGNATDDLMGWQGRYFGYNPKHSRYHTEGQVDDIFWYQNLPAAEKHGIIVVEDCVSAIKVGRYATACPLLGSTLSIKKRTHFKFVSDKLTFWLDYDKADAAYRYAQQCQILGYKTRVVVTHQDPKEIFDDDMEEILSGVEYT